jgi:hypothetical protein
MEIAFFTLVGCIFVFGYWLYRDHRDKGGVTTDEYHSVSPTTQRGTWSGISHGPLPVGYLTMSQYGCLAEASYGVRIMSGPLSQMDCQQPYGFSTHGARTVESLAGHGFLADHARGGYTITDLGLRASEVLGVKY